MTYRLNLMRLLTFSCILGTWLLIASCDQQPDPSENTVASVNEAYLSSEFLNNRVPPKAEADVRVAVKRDLMEKWIEDEIYYQSAVKEGFSLSSEERQMVNEFQKRLLIQKFLDAKLSRNYKITEQEIVDYYDKHRSEFAWKEDHVHLVHLFMESIDREIDKQVNKSNDLNELIKKYFFDQQSTLDMPIGDLGYVKLEELPKAVARSIAKLRTGRISRRIKSELGYHYVQILDRVKSGDSKGLEQVRDEIVIRLKIQKRNEQLGQLKKELLPRFKIQTDLTRISQP